MPVAYSAAWSLAICVWMVEMFWDTISMFRSRTWSKAATIPWTSEKEMEKEGCHSQLSVCSTVHWVHGSVDWVDTHGSEVASPRERSKSVILEDWDLGWGLFARKNIEESRCWLLVSGDCFSDPWYEDHCDITAGSSLKLLSNAINTWHTQQAGRHSGMIGLDFVFFWIGLLLVIFSLVSSKAP